LYFRFVVPLTFNLAAFLSFAGFAFASFGFTGLFVAPTTLPSSEDESESLDEEDDDELDEEELLLLLLLEDEEEDELLELVVLSESLSCSMSSRLKAFSPCCGGATFFLALRTILLLFESFFDDAATGTVADEVDSSFSFFVADFFIDLDESSFFNSFSAFRAYLSDCSTLGTDTGDSLSTAGRPVASSLPADSTSSDLLSVDGDALMRLRALARIS
jgi:hypothetical protein